MLHFFCLASLSCRYSRDVRFGANERRLKALEDRNLERGITRHPLLEVIGMLSFQAVALGGAERIVDSKGLQGL